MAQESSALSEEANTKPLREGELYKKGQINRSWRKRYFVLYEGRRLAYFEKKEDFSKDKNPISEIDLSGVQSIHLVPTQEEYQKARLLQKQSSDLTYDPESARTSKKASINIFSNLLQGSNTMLADGGTNNAEEGWVESNDGIATLGTPSSDDGDLEISVSNSVHKSSLNANQRKKSSSQKKPRQLNYVDKEHAFAIVTAKRVYVLCANNKFELDSWRDAIENATFGGRLYEGWLVKRGAMRKSWKRRWFVIFDTHEMRYYDNENNMQPMGLIKLHEVLLMCPGDADQYTLPYTIQLLTPERNWVIAAETKKLRDEWLLRLKESIPGAKQLLTSHEGYLWKKVSTKSEKWRKHYFAMSKGWLFYFDNALLCQKFKSIVFFSESFFQQAVQTYVKGNISLHQTVVQKLNSKEVQNLQPRATSPLIIINTNDMDPISSPILTSTTSEDSLNDQYRDYVSTTFKEYVFQIITSNQKEYYLACDNSQEMNEWFKAFYKTHNDGFISQIHAESDYKSSDEENISNLEIRLQKQVSNDKLLTETEEEPEPESNITEDKKGHKKKQNSLFQLLDPNGNGKWRDVEDPSLVQAQPDLVRKATQHVRQVAHV